MEKNGYFLAPLKRKILKIFKKLYFSTAKKQKNTFNADLEAYKMREVYAERNSTDRGHSTLHLSYRVP